MGDPNGKYTAKTAFDVILDEHEPLDKEDLRWLLDIYRDPDSSEEDKKAAHDSIVIHNLRLVRWIAGFKYRHNHNADTFNAGFIGLLRAIEKYDPDKGTFSVYAVPWISGAIQEYRERGNVIRTPSHVRKAIRKYKKAYMRLRQELQEDPTKEEVLEESGIDRILEDPNELVCRYWHFTVNDSQEVDLADQDEIVYFEYDRASLDAITADPNGKPVSEQFVNEELIEEILPELLDLLDKRKQYILRMRFSEGKTLREIADTLQEDVSGVQHRTKERVRQLENEAINKMRKYAEKHYPEYF